ncbi:MAG: hypothetical protein R2821_01585 [Flavobacteriaceae bacterium]
MNDNIITYNGVFSSGIFLSAMLMTHGAIEEPLKRDIPEPSVNKNISLHYQNPNVQGLSTNDMTTYYISDSTTEVFENFIFEVLTNTKDMDPKIVDFVNDNFWDLI